jgi:hypothetical protein
MTLVCSVCGKNALQEVKGEIVFNGQTRKNCSALICNCGNLEQVKTLDHSTQRPVQNPTQEMRTLIDKIAVKDRTIATHEQDLANAYAQIDQKTEELERANQELRKYQNGIEQPTNQPRQKR